MTATPASDGDAVRRELEPARGRRSSCGRLAFVYATGAAREAKELEQSIAILRQVRLQRWVWLAGQGSAGGTALLFGAEPVGTLGAGSFADCPAATASAWAKAPRLQAWIVVPERRSSSQTAEPSGPASATLTRSTGRNSHMAASR